jgi:hypothetical protein
MRGKAGGQESRKAGGQEGRKAGRQEGRKAGEQEGRRAGEQESRKAGRRKSRTLTPAVYMFSATQRRLVLKILPPTTPDFILGNFYMLKVLHPSVW